MWYCCCHPGNSHGSSWLKNLRAHNRRRHSHNDCEWSAYKAHTSHSGGQPLSGNVPHFHFALIGICNIHVYYIYHGKALSAT